MAEPYDFRHGHQLKTTCDACHAAKVRCSQAHPTCARCESRRLRCQYSVSLRSLKQSRPQQSNVSGRDSSSTSPPTNSSSHASPQQFASSSTAPSSTLPMGEPCSLSFDPQLSAFDEVGFASFPSRDSWPTDLFGSTGSAVYADATDDARMLTPQRTGSNMLSVSRVSHSHNPGRQPIDDNGQSHKSEDLPATTCSCQQNILSKLSNISVTSRLDRSIPFDTSLAENKTVVNLCASLVNCPNEQHDQDIALMLTGLALITQIITVYDHRLRNPHIDNNNDSAVTDFVLNNLADSDVNTSVDPRVRGVITRRPQQAKPLNNVRLSLGSYELDQKDEAVLQSSLLKIELSKIGSLIASFERRFCALGYQSERGSQLNEPKPLGEVIAHLKKKVKVNYERLASFQ